MIYYLFDHHRVFIGAESSDKYDPAPADSATIKPPTLAAGEFAQWTGRGWVVLGEYPVPPEPPAPDPIYPQFTALEMLDLFTEAEQISVAEATMAVPKVKLWYDRLIAATFVSYEDPRTEAGLNALVQAELLDPGRKSEIVAAMQPQVT